MWNGGCNYKMNWMPEVVRPRLARDCPRSDCFVYLFAADRNRKHEKKKRPDNKGARLPPNRPPFPCCSFSPILYFRVLFPSSFMHLHFFPLSDDKTVVRTRRNFSCDCQGVSTIGLLFRNLSLRFRWNIGCRARPIFRALESHILKLVTHFKH